MCACQPAPCLYRTSRGRPRSSTTSRVCSPSAVTAEGEQTRLVVEERGLPLDVLYKHGAGWQAHIEDLGRYLAGGESNWKARWSELSPAYQSLGLSANGS